MQDSSSPTAAHQTSSITTDHNLNHMQLSCHFCYYSSLADFFTNFSASSNLVGTTARVWSQTGIVGGAILERPSANIRSQNFCRLPFRENWIPRKFPVIQLVYHTQNIYFIYLCDRATKSQPCPAYMALRTIQHSICIFVLLSTIYLHLITKCA